MFIPTSVEKKIYASIHKKNVERTYFLRSFRRLIEQYEYIFLFPHINPDGDCIGGVLGFKEILKQNYPDKKVFAVGSAFGLFDWLKLEFDEMPKRFDFSEALAIVIDVGTKDRIQEYSAYFEEPKTRFGYVVKIDHHESISDLSFDLSWDDGTYIASCVQLVQIADYYSWEISPKAATYLYLGIYTDSQRFLFPTTVARSLVVAAKTWRAGADYKLIHQKLTFRTWESIAINQYLLANCNKEDGIIWFYLTKAIMKKQKIETNKGLVNTFLNIEGVAAWVMFTDKEDGSIQVEFRSMGADVRTLAMKFGGGGHEHAAGALIKDKKLIPEIVKATKAVAKDYMNNISNKKSAWESGYEEPKIAYEEQPSDTVEVAKNIVSESKELVGDKAIES